MPNQPHDSSLKRLSGIKEGFARLLSPNSEPAGRAIRAAALDELNFDGDEEEEGDREKKREMTDHPSSEITSTGVAFNLSASQDDSEETTNAENIPSAPVVYSVVIFFLPVSFNERTQESTPQPPISGPYTPKSISLYGRGDGTYYTKEKRYQEAEQSDDEFGITIRGVPYPQPVVYHYPDAHPDLEKFPRSERQAELAALQQRKEQERKYGGFL